MGRLGLITIGQSPRQDIVQDMLPILGSSQELLQRGALDNLTATQLQNLAPNRGEQVLVSSLQDGTSVVLAETKVVNVLQVCIQELEQKGAQCILLLCTGDFHTALSAQIPLLLPNRILEGLIPALLNTEKRFITLVPDRAQSLEVKKQWESKGIQTDVFAISPYTNTLRDFEDLALQLRKSNCTYILMDCMGYSSEMKEVIASVSRKKVLLPRTLCASVVKGIL